MRRRRVEPLALTDQALRPDHSSAGVSFTGTPRTSSLRVGEPFVVDFRDAVAGAVDHVDKLVAVVCALASQG